MGQWTKARIQLCGRFVADIDGSRIEDTLPGRIGRIVFAYLVLIRGRPLPRDTLLMAGWGEDAPAEARNALNVLLSRLRHGLGAEHLRGRAEIELLLPPAIFVDAEAALEGAHRAESAIAEGRWAQAWGPAGIAYHVATRPFRSLDSSTLSAFLASAGVSSPQPAMSSVSRGSGRPRLRTR